MAVGLGASALGRLAGQRETPLGLHCRQWNAPWETVGAAGGRGRWASAAVNVLVQYFVNICNIGSPIFPFCLKCKRRKKLENLLPVFCALLNARWFGRVLCCPEGEVGQEGDAILTPARTVYLEPSWGKISAFQSRSLPGIALHSVAFSECLLSEDAFRVRGFPLLLESQL